MSFQDIIKKSILEDLSGSTLNFWEMMVVLFVTLLLSLFIFIIYFLYTQRSFYNRNFNISLVVCALMSAGIVVALQSNFAISLGMVGALSIVRFRTAIKEPIDLAFLFWAIGIGIMCGAGMYSLTVVISILIALIMCLLQVTPLGRVSMLLIVNLKEISVEQEVVKCARRYYKFATIKTNTVYNDNTVSCIIELKVKDQAAFLAEIGQIAGVKNTQLVVHKGDANY